MRIEQHKKSKLCYNGDGIQNNITGMEPVKAIMLSFAVLHYQGETVHETLLLSVDLLRRFYEATGRESFLRLADAEIIAFLCMGFPFPTLPEEMRQFLEQRELRERAQNYHMGKTVKLCRSQIKLLFTRWAKSKETPMTITQVADDIIAKVRERRIGTWEYVSRRPGGGNGKKSGDGEDEERYELIVKEEESFFWDLKNFRFYSFEE